MEAGENEERTLALPVNVWTVAAVLVALFQLKALGDNPYDYYVNLRWITLAIAAFGAYATFHFEHLGWTLLFFGVALVYSPLIPVHLARSTWAPLNIATAICFVVASVTRSRRPWRTA
jgi:hypothetical protein